MSALKVWVRAGRRHARAAAVVSCAAVCACMVHNLLSNDDVFATHATVRNLAGLDGCGWVLEAEPGDHYEPTNLDPAFHHDGLRVWVQLRRRHDLVSICMVGPIVDVVATHVGVDAPHWGPGRGG